MDAVNNIKSKVIKDFTKLLKRASKGYKDDYELILEEISFVELGGILDNPTEIYQYLMSSEF